MNVKKIAAAIVLIIIAYLVFVNYVQITSGCMKTEMTEDFINFIDDDCDWEIDEDYADFQCGNGIIESFEYCDDGNTLNLDGCSMDCKVETNNSIYAVSYVGNIDGDFGEEWYYVYDMITEFHDKNRIYSGFSVYPVSIKTGKFGRIFSNIYNSPYIEFIQKGYRGGGDIREEHIDDLSFAEQKEIISEGRSVYEKMAKKILGTDDVELPISYNQPQGRMTESIRQALIESGLKMFFDLYLNEELGPVESTPDFDVFQYGASITVTGEAGRHTVFRTVENITAEIKGFDRVDLYVLNVSGRKVVPVWFHHYDMEDIEIDNKLDWDKWKRYAEIMYNLKKDPDIIMVRPVDIYNMRHAGGSL